MYVPSAALLARAFRAVVLAVEVVRDDAPALCAVLIHEADDGVVLLARPGPALVGGAGLSVGLAVSAHALACGGRCLADADASEAVEICEELWCPQTFWRRFKGRFYQGCTSKPRNQGFSREKSTNLRDPLKSKRRASAYAAVQDPLMRYDKEM